MRIRDLNKEQIILLQCTSRSEQRTGFCLHGSYQAYLRDEWTSRVKTLLRVSLLRQQSRSAECHAAFNFLQSLSIQMQRAVTEQVHWRAFSELRIRVRSPCTAAGKADG